MSNSLVLNNNYSEVKLNDKISMHLDDAIQVEPGRDVDRLIKKMNETNINKLSKNNKKHKKEKNWFKKLKLGLAITGTVLVTAAIIGAIATAIFGTGIVAPPLIILAITGILAILPTQFGLFRDSLSSLTQVIKDEGFKKVEMKELTKLIEKTKNLLEKRVDALQLIEDEERRKEHKEDILRQIKQLNKFIAELHDQVPSTIDKLEMFNPAVLLNKVNKEEE